jgi:hypothetical protein
MSHQVALCRLWQGGVSNVVKHASAKNVRVSIRSRNHSMIIMVGSISASRRWTLINTTRCVNSICTTPAS